jgi:PLP dependent protein
MTRISEKIKSVQTRLSKAAGEADLPRLVAVSKTRPEQAIREAAESGLREFGENYLQEAIPKIEALADLNLTWHFIGSIQSNKTADIARNFDWVHTLEREKIARRLSDSRPENLLPLNLLIQVNIDEEESKAGVSAEEIFELAKRMQDLPRVKLRGLMAIPKPRADFEAQLSICQQMKHLYDQLKQQYAEIDTLSLGMSSDLEAAVQAGSSLVRIGTDIFGART